MWVDTKRDEVVHYLNDTKLREHFKKMWTQVCNPKHKESIDKGIVSLLKEFFNTNKNNNKNNKQRRQQAVLKVNV